MKVIAYQVTAVRGDFRRVGRTFKHRVTTTVDASTLTPEQAKHLESSDPRRELLVVAVYEADGIGTSPSEHIEVLPEEGAEAAAPAVDAPIEDESAGEPSDEPGEDDLDGEVDEEPGDSAPAEGAAPATSAPPPAQRRKKGKRK